MSDVSPIANEAALRYLAAELQNAQLQAAQVVGNLALANSIISELKKKIEELEGEEDA